MIKKKEFIQELQKMGACGVGIKFVEQWRTPNIAWKKCTVYVWMKWYLSKLSLHLPYEEIAVFIWEELNKNNDIVFSEKLRIADKVTCDMIRYVYPTIPDWR